MEAEMSNLGERAASQVVGSGKPTNAEMKALNGGFKQLMDVHAEVFALVKRLGMRSDEQVRRELDPSVDRLAQQLAEMTELYAALRKAFQSEDVASDGDALPNDLAEAMATLDAINPGSPEWGPAFLQVSELVEAHVSEEKSSSFQTRANPVTAWQPADLG